MNLLSVLKSIGHVLLTGLEDGTKIGVAASPAIGLIPVWGPVAVTALGAISAAEKLIPGPSQGAAKKTVVATILAASQPQVPTATVSVAIDELVAALNALSAAMGKLENPPPAPTVPA